MTDTAAALTFMFGMGMRRAETAAADVAEKIRAYQVDNGRPIDVLDAEGNAVGSTTSLAPAHSIKRLRLEGITGWHSVTIEHDTARAMRSATVALMLRDPDVGVRIEHVQGIEDCTPAVTTAQ